MRRFFHRKFAFTLDLSLEDLFSDIKNYRFFSFKDDLLASLSVALLAIPQSIAYSLLAGLPPEAGLFSAIFGVMITAFFGSSRHLISGPSTGVAILLQSTIASTIHTYYPNLPASQMMPTVMHCLGQILFIIAILQLVFSLMNIGKLLRFVSRSVVLGYFMGVLVAIIVTQMNYVLGIDARNLIANTTFFRAIDLLSQLDQINYASILITITGIILLVLLKKSVAKGPSTLIMLVILTLISFGVNQFFSKYFMIPNLGDMGFDDSWEFTFHMFVFDLGLIDKIFPACLAISLLSILEVSSISRMMSVKSGQTIRVNQDVFSVGLANLFLSFLIGSMPASGSLTRSMVNLSNKAKTRFSAIFSGGLVALFTYFSWPYISLIPLAALASILLMVVPSLIHTDEIKLCLKATRGDRIVFILTVLSCIFFSLNIAFFIGVVISIAFYLRRAADPFLIEYAFNSAGRMIVVSPKDERKRVTRIIGVEGELFFGVVDFMQSAINKIIADPYIKVLIIRLNRVHYIDATTCFAILRLHSYLKATDRHLVISGLSEEVWNTFYRTGIAEMIHQDNLFLTDETKPQLSTWRATLRAQDLLSDMEKL